MSENNGKIKVDGKTYDIVTLDFETYYSKDYTLSGKMNMSEYIRDDQFHVHGVGIKVRNNKTKWYDKGIVTALHDIDWSKSALLCHNTQFDGFILSEIYGITPAFYLDTLPMARGAHGHHTRHDLDTIAKLHGLGGKVKRHALADTKGKETLTQQESDALGEYCVDDVDDTYSIFWKMIDYIPEPELRLIHITTRMFCDPILEVDYERAQQELRTEMGIKAESLLNCGATAEQLLSNAKFAELLAEALGNELLIPKKISLATGKVTYAFSKADLEFKKLLNHPDEKVRKLVDARMRIKSTIGETRAIRLLEAGKDGRKLPVALNYSGAHTHRWSGGNKMNLQNLKRGGELRRSILAPEGHAIVVADSSQIEARVLAWLAGQMDILNAFASKQDVYKLMASSIYGVPVDQVTSDQRFIGKVCVLGLGYGMGATKLQLTLAQGIMGPPVNLDLIECKRIVNLYRAKNDKITDLWKKMSGVIASMATGVNGEIGPMRYGKYYIMLPNEMFLQYPDLQTEITETMFGTQASESSYLARGGRSRIYGGLLTENVVQALARCIIAEQLLAIEDMGYRAVTTTHDEIVVVCPVDKADKCLEDMLHAMSTPPDWAPGIPLAAEGGWDLNYSK